MNVWQSPSTSQALAPATKLQGDAFVLGKVLGTGGFGITYHSGDMRLRRYVAIKEFFPSDCNRSGSYLIASDIAEFTKAKNKFLEEARTLAQFNHPGIVKVISVFEENNTAYMVMEFLQGSTLQQIVEKNGVLTEGKALEYIQQAGDALQKVHETLIIHRDIKPDNIIVCEDGRVVVIDFGLNKKIEFVGNHQTRRLSTTKQLGTDGYAPPEQYLRHTEVDVVADIYSLGAALYFLLTGEVPISAPQRAMGETLLPPNHINPTVSSTVNAAVLRAMEIKGEQRPQTVQDFLDSLKPKVKAPQTNATQPVPQQGRSYCPSCTAINLKSSQRCVSCGEILPWAKQSAKVSRQQNQPDFRMAYWGVNKTLVRTSEIDEPFRETGELLVYAGNVAGLETIIYYDFIEDMLVSASYIIIEEHSNFKLYLNDYDNLKNALSTKYGIPISDDIYWTNDSLRDDYQNWGLAVSIGECSMFAKWEDRNTEIMLALYGDNHSINFSISYRSLELKYLLDAKIEQQNLEGL